MSQALQVVERALLLWNPTLGPKRFGHLIRGMYAEQQREACRVVQVNPDSPPQERRAAIVGVLRNADPPLSRSVRHLLGEVAVNPGPICRESAGRVFAIDSYIEMRPADLPSPDEVSATAERQPEPEGPPDTGRQATLPGGPHRLLREIEQRIRQGAPKSEIEDALFSLTGNEIEDLQRRTGIKLVWSDSDPLAPWNRTQRMGRGF